MKLQYLVYNHIDDTYYDGTNYKDGINGNFDGYANNAQIFDSKNDALEVIEKCINNELYVLLSIIEIYQKD